MNIAKEILELIPSTKNIKIELDLVIGFKLLQEFIDNLNPDGLEIDANDIIPFKFKAADLNNRCHIICKLVVKPYLTNYLLKYELFERLLNICGNFGLIGPDYKGQIKCFAAGIIFESNFSLALRLIMDCVDLEYGKSWLLCQQTLLSHLFHLSVSDKDKLV